MIHAAMDGSEAITTFFNRLQQEADDLFALVDRFARARVLAIGDLTLDEFLTGEVERISREAPVPILRYESTRQIPGGGANAVYNLAQLGAKVRAIGCIGCDPQGEALANMFAAVGIDSSGIVREAERPTVTKTRISGHARQSVTQQIVRVDRLSDAPPTAPRLQELARHIESQIAAVDAVVCSDYGRGTLSGPTIAAALTHGRTIVDAQLDLPRYAGATIFTPNVPEAENAVGYAITDTDSLLAAGQDLLRATQAEYILLTRGEAGMSLFARDRAVEHIPAFNRREVFDVTGAGDTVVAGLTLGLCGGGSYWQAAVLGNLAASLVVRQFGTATTTPAALREALRALLTNGPA